MSSAMREFGFTHEGRVDPVKKLVVSCPFEGLDYAIIAKDQGIEKFNQVVKGDKFCEANGDDKYDNSSCSAFDEIWLGIYDDAELKAISFFHELGHIKDDVTQHEDKYEQEKKAWDVGYKLAEKYGLTFSDKAKSWADESYNFIESSDYLSAMKVQLEIAQELERFREKSFTERRISGLTYMMKDMVEFANDTKKMYPFDTAQSFHDSIGEWYQVLDKYMKFIKKRTF